MNHNQTIVSASHPSLYKRISNLFKKQTGPQRIYLVRHGESEGNVDKTTYLRKPDHAINLTPRGQEQAFKAGQFLREEFNKAGLIGTDIRLWLSPYTRTRQTADHLQLGAGNNVFRDRFEDISLREQQFGLFDGYDTEELAIHFPNEHAYYKKHEDFSGRFYATVPLGESRCQVAERVKPFFDTLIRDAEKRNIQTNVIVTHGVTLRAFIMQWLHYTPEWFEDEPNPGNTSIYLLERDQNNEMQLYRDINKVNRTNARTPAAPAP
jgi:2,3-bisphosphoglycerate-dependent phosphoglycerate mutase